LLANNELYLLLPTIRILSLTQEVAAEPLTQDTTSDDDSTKDINFSWTGRRALGVSDGEKISVTNEELAMIGI